jgi:hypothetical protein
MLTKSPLPLASIVVAALLVTGCSAASARQDPAPAAVQAVPGSPVQQVRLTEQAIHRLGITTVPVRMAKVTLEGQRGTHKLIPYSAVVYNNDDSTWTFVNTGPRTYLRQRITVGAIQGNTAVLTAGPAVSAAVVTVGAPELLGTEYNISGEE